MESTAIQGSSTNDAESRLGIFKLSLPFHLLAASWIFGMLLLARYRTEYYVGLLQEDRQIEWATVWLFGAAGIILLRRAIRHRLLVDLLVGAFCLIVAGEEFSWGQRLIGYGSPEYFLAHNYQQEVNLHNLPGSVIKPKWFLIAALIGYGIILPIIARSARLGGILKRLGATPPPIQLIGWFAVAVILLVWYPFTLTGEWIETFAGGLFVASITLTSGTPWIVLSLALIFGVSMTHITNRVELQRNLDRSACARMELEALLDDIALGEMSTEKLKSRQSVHKRIWIAASQGYLNRQAGRKFDGTQCGKATVDESQDRRNYLVDPWGMSYWLSVQRVDRNLQHVVVYSFGPNRRRDGSPGATSSDDIAVNGYLREEPELEFSTP